jgi:hypothetical protein
MRLFQNFSFGTAALDLREKAGRLNGKLNRLDLEGKMVVLPFFPKPFPKPTGFWEGLYRRLIEIFDTLGVKIHYFNSLFKE